MSSVPAIQLSPLWDLFFGTCLALLVTWYFLENLENRAQRSVSYLRQTLFYAGLALTAAILVGPVAHQAISHFWVHMVQHILLMMLISPLLILGSPFKLALESRFTGVRRFFTALASNQLVRQLFKPEVGFGIFLFVLILTHFSPLANAGMRNPNVHSLELILFLIGGLIYYYSVMDGNPQPHPVQYSKRVISLFAMMLPETMIGFFLYSGNRVLHDLPTGISMSMGLSDQHTGGAIMWAMGMLIDTIWIVLAARDWFMNEAKIAEEEDE